MRAPLVLALLLAFAATVTRAFVPPTSALRRSPSSSPSPRVRSSPKPLALSPLDVADALVAAAADTDYEYGAVAAPGAWCLACVCGDDLPGVLMDGWMDGVGFCL